MLTATFIPSYDLHEFLYHALVEGWPGDQLDCVLEVKDAEYLYPILYAAHYIKTGETRCLVRLVERRADGFYGHGKCDESGKLRTELSDLIHLMQQGHLQRLELP